MSPWYLSGRGCKDLVSMTQLLTYTDSSPCVMNEPIMKSLISAFIHSAATFSVLFMVPVTPIISPASTSSMILSNSASKRPFSIYSWMTLRGRRRFTTNFFANVLFSTCFPYPVSSCSWKNASFPNDLFTIILPATDAVTVVSSSPLVNSAH